MAKKLLQLQSKAWAVAIRSLGLPLTCLFSRSDRHLTWRLAEICFGSQKAGVYPQVSLLSLVRRCTTITLSELPSEHFNVTEAELLALCAIANLLRPAVAFEFGTADGRTTLNLAINVDREARVYTLNLPLDQDRTHRQDSPVGSRFRDHPASDRIVQLWGDSAQFDFRPYEGRCQLVFIDADHSAAAVYRDSESALRLVDKRLGVILWHDALRYGVRKSLPRFARAASLPVHLLEGTNLAMLCFANGSAIGPSDWAHTAGSMNRNEPSK
jgi:predicted O-methyltransferase YrrM